MNEQLPNQTKDRPRILIVDNNSQFARSARLLVSEACTSNLNLNKVRETQL
jgi:hypothetical protein